MGAHLYRGSARSHPVPASATVQQPSSPAAGRGDRGALLRHRVRPQRPRPTRPRPRPRAVRHPYPARRRHPGSAGRGPTPGPPLRRRDLRVHRPGRPAHLLRHHDRTRAGTGRGAAGRRRRADARRPQTGHRHPHPSGQAGRGRVVRARSPGKILGRVQGAHRAGLQHRPPTLRLPRREDPPPGTRPTRTGQDQDPARASTRSAPRSCATSTTCTCPPGSG